MSVTSILWMIAGAWVAIGVTLSVTMRRRGHDAWVWLTLGTLLGPLALLLAFERVRYHPKSGVVGPMTGGAGRLDVLVGVDGSPYSVEAMRHALRLLGNSMTSLTLVTVLAHDTTLAGSPAAARADAEAMLASVAGEVTNVPVATRVLYGRADRAMTDHAMKNGIELLVVGPRGRGMSKSLFGSVAARLVGGSPLPVLIGPNVPSVDTKATPSAAAWSSPTFQ